VGIVLLLLGIQGCSDPLSISTPRNVVKSQLPTTIPPPTAGQVAADSVVATFNDQLVVFAGYPERTLWHNQEIAGRQYLNVQSTRVLNNGRQYDLIALRLDGIADTGVYNFNAPYVDPQKSGPDTTSHEISARVQRRTEGTSIQTYGTGTQHSHGQIHVEEIDHEHRIIYGSFWLVAYTIDESDSIRVDQGGFRLNLDIK
jgi:hypothetical protein